MADAELLRRVFEAWADYHELGNTVVDEPRARFVSNPKAPRVHDANLISSVRAATNEEIEAVLVRADEIYGGLGLRKVNCDPGTPPSFEARLVLEGYEPHPHLQMLLEGGLRAMTNPSISIRLVETDDDWRSLTALWQLDHDEEVAKGRREAWEPEVTSQMVASKRAKAPDLRFWLARMDGDDCAFFSSWPGRQGVGIVEDLFTAPLVRRRGIATALIAHAVGDARERGAGPIVIAARPDDTPKHMYAALGFRPFCVRRSYVRTD